MKERIYIVTIFLALTASLASATEPVTFADAYLKAIVEKTLGISDPSADDMLKLTTLHAGSREITDLSGIEYAKNLTSLCVHRNKIKDISPVRGLIKIQYLCLHSNQISDTSPVSELTNMTGLLLHSNKVIDLAPVGKLTNLTSLYLNNNTIKDISAVAGLKQLRLLDISTNQVGDISAVAGLSELVDLRIQDNNVSDVSPVTKLANLKALHVYGNPAVIPKALLADNSVSGVIVDSTQYAKSAKEDSAAIGRINLFGEVTDLLVSRNRCTIRVLTADGTGRLPVGKYRVTSWAIEKKDKEEVVWELTASVCSEELGVFEVTDAEAVKLDIGGPIVASLSATKNYYDYTFSQKVAGKMGESITITRNGLQSGLPRLHIKNKAGTYDKTFHFRYG
jgi:internalin A